MLQRVTMRSHGEIVRVTMPAINKCKAAVEDRARYTNNIPEGLCWKVTSAEIRDDDTIAVNLVDDDGIAWRTTIGAYGEYVGEIRQLVANGEAFYLGGGWEHFDWKPYFV